MKEAWIRVVGMPLHLWRQEILKRISDSCGGFMAIDKEIVLRVKVAWVRILVRVKGKTRPIVHIFFGGGGGGGGDASSSTSCGKFR